MLQTKTKPRLETNKHTSPKTC